MTPDDPHVRMESSAVAFFCASGVITEEGRAISLKLQEHRALARYFARWLFLAGSTGLAIGALVALFLESLEMATRYRIAHPPILSLLPIAGLAIGWVYSRWGRSVQGGNNLIMDQIHEPGGGVPVRMAPLVLLGTVATHLFGGSAGREGTAVQMGGSLASAASRLLGLDEGDTRTLLMVGVAAGFGAVFGTPLTGAIFALEVLVIGRLESHAVVPALIGSIVGDWTVGALGVHHAAYAIAPLAGLRLRGGILGVSWPLLAAVGAAGIAFGLAGLLFAELTHGLERMWKRTFSSPLVRPMVGGLVVILLVQVLGTRDHIGLGVTSSAPGGVSIASSFHAGGAHAWSWWWKTLLTAITLSSGFKGGEVTPLFFVGATLGNALAPILHAPVDLMAGVGFIAVFAGATNTPLACTIMGIELFGAPYAIYFAVACAVAYVFSGHSGIYLSQRIGHPKSVEIPVLPEMPLRGLSGEGVLAPPSFDLQPGAAPLVSQTHKHTLASNKMGLLRIYLDPRARFKPKGGFFSFGRPLYRELILAAKRDGIPSAMAHHVQYGFSDGGKILQRHPEYRNTANLFVELIGPREQLEFFCRKHADLFKDRVVIHKPVEQWTFAVADSSSEPDVHIA